MDEKALRELVKASRAAFLVQLHALEDPDKREKPEVVLARAGYGAAEIAALLNKGMAGVAKAIQRSAKAS